MTFSKKILEKNSIRKKSTNTIKAPHLFWGAFNVNSSSYLEAFAHYGFIGIH